MAYYNKMKAEQARGLLAFAVRQRRLMRDLAPFVSSVRQGSNGERGEYFRTLVAMTEAASEATGADMSVGAVADVVRYHGGIVETIKALDSSSVDVRRSMLEQLGLEPSPNSKKDQHSDLAIMAEAKIVAMAFENAYEHARASQKNVQKSGVPDSQLRVFAYIPNSGRLNRGALKSGGLFSGVLVPLAPSFKSARRNRFDPSV